LETERLALRRMEITHSEFIFELLNTPDWLRFIGDRNVKSEGDAQNYIKRINLNPSTTYWVITLKENSVPVGIVSLVKRDFLDHYDIGFALLPRYEKMGYALEATRHVLQIESQKRLHEKILAVTITNNQKSIHLFEKLGLRLKETIEKGSETLSVYST
jgi:ribosomal-protein-alanine N-acetyltransferase